MAGNQLIGTWGSPDLGFPGFRAFTKELKKANQENLLQAAPEDLPLTLRFNLVANNPFSGFRHPGRIVVQFDRDPAGRFFVREDAMTDDVAEWLASYHSRLSREHTGEELKRYAPLGAAKLYERIKRKQITKIE